MIYLGSDHAGLEHKKQVMVFLAREGIPFVDVGTYSASSSDYPDYAFLVCQHVADEKNAVGILICSSGTGMCIAANKVPQIRAALAYDAFSARMAREHNNTNVLCLRAQGFSPAKNVSLVKTWLSSRFSQGERHVRRLCKIAAFEGDTWSQSSVRERIVPAVIAKNKSEFQERLKKIASFGSVHLDVMDGAFVFSRSLDFSFSKLKGKFVAAHLMVTHPLAWIEQHGTLVDYVFFHVESKDDARKVILAARKRGLGVGIALNPKTPLRKVLSLAPLVDSVLVMSVEPGKYGSAFVPSVVKKIQTLRQAHPLLDIVVDGGVNDKTLRKVAAAGASRFVVGSYFQNARNAAAVSSRLKTLERVLYR